MRTFDTEPSGLEEVPGLLQSVWRYKWLIIFAMLLGGSLGYGWASRQPTLYEGVTRVLLAGQSSTPLAGGTPPPAAEPDRYLRNQAELISSSEVLQRAAKLNGGRVPAKTLHQRLNVDVATDSDVITIRVLDPTAEGAAAAANSVAAAYDDFISERSRGAVNQLRSVRSRLETRLKNLEAELATQPNDESLRRRRTAVLEELSAIEKQLVASEALAGSSRQQLHEEAAIPEQPVQPAPRRSIAIGVLFGLVGSGALAWWLSGRQAARANQARGREPSAVVPPAPTNVGGALGVAPRGTVPGADVVRPLVDTLARDPNIDWEALCNLLVGLDEALADTSLAPYFDALPRVMAQEVTGSFSTDIVALLLDNSQGSFEVAAGIGLSADERGAVVDQNHQVLRQVLWDGVGVLQDDNGPRMTAAADLPGGRSADALVMVPLVQGSSWLGMLLVGRRSANGHSANGFSDKEVKRAIRCAADYAPIIQTLLVAHRLQQSLQVLRSSVDER
jgi:capsular polysaccharide biosynthesis protein